MSTKSDGMEHFMDKLKFLEEQAMGIIKDPSLTHEQTMMKLAGLGMNILDTPNVPNGYFELKSKGIICDLFEGNAPYVPRYILPDYDVFMKNGSEFLRLSPPKNLLDATTSLLILYKHVPSVTHFPVYIGRIDKLLEPFITGAEHEKQIIKNFLLQIDRTITDSFCHGNIGPEDSKAGRIILECERELQNSTPNITLLYDPELTSNEFATFCVEAALDCAKPSFANHAMYKAELGDNYGISSCYNGLPVNGGAFTLTRIKLSHIAEESKDASDFFNNTLPNAIDTMLAFMDVKIDFLVNETPFFKSNFLVKEGMLSADRFNGLFGMVGLNECVNTLMQREGKADKFGFSKEADALGIKVMDFIEDRVNSHENKHCPYWNNHFMLHAQVGTDLDVNTSPGTRIAIGDEPEDLYAHIRQAAPFHKYFPSGTGDIFPFDSTTIKNPASVVDIIKGSFKLGMRYFSTYTQDSDVIRITGYLVKRSDIEKLSKGEAVVNDTVVLGMGNVNNSKTYERKLTKL